MHRPIAALLALSLANCLSGDAIQLAFHPSTGQETTYHTTTQVKERTKTSPGAETSNEYIKETWETERVASVEDGATTIMRTYHRARATGRYEETLMDYDSLHGELPPELRDTPAFGLSKLVGKCVQYSLDASNHVVEGEGWQELVDGTMSGVIENGTMQGLVTPEVFQMALSLMFVTYPRWKVSPGCHWSTQASVSNALGLSFQTRRENELRAVTLESGRLIARINSNIRPVIDSLALGRASESIRITGGEEFVSDIDLATGILWRSESTSRMGVTVEFDAGGIDVTRETRMEGVTTTERVGDWK